MVIAVELFPERQCSRCTDRQKKQWGCNGNAQQPLTIDGEEDDTCPRRPLLDDPIGYNQLFLYTNAYSSGFLPEDGGLQSQPDRLMRLIHMTGAFRAECADEKRNTPRVQHS